MVGFQQAAIAIEKEQEFQRLKREVERVFGPNKVGKFLRRVKGAGLRIRDLEGILARGLLEELDGGTSQGLYLALTVSDQAQLREFYLFQVEKVAPALRAKFKKLYQYY
jgi:hypothetical protein